MWISDINTNIKYKPYDSFNILRDIWSNLDNSGDKRNYCNKSPLIGLYHAITYFADISECQKMY